MTVFVLEDHSENVKICLLDNLGLGAARFVIFVRSIELGWNCNTEKCRRIFWSNAVGVEDDSK